MKKTTQAASPRCSICNGPYEGFGHNPAPVAEGRCCTVCNDFVVIPERIRGTYKKRTTSVENETVVTLRDTVILRATKKYVHLNHGGFVTQMTARHMNNWLVRLGIDYRVSRRGGQMTVYSIVNPDEISLIGSAGITLQLK